MLLMEGRGGGGLNGNIEPCIPENSNRGHGDQTVSQKGVWVFRKNECEIERGIKGKERDPKKNHHGEVMPMRMHYAEYQLKFSRAYSIGSPFRPPDMNAAP
jgi:hypothetical protein